MAVGHLQTGFGSVDERCSNHFKRVLAKTPFTHSSAIKNEMSSICIIQLCYQWTLHEPHLTLDNYTFWCDHGVPLAVGVSTLIKNYTWKSPLLNWRPPECIGFSHDFRIDVIGVCYSYSLCVSLACRDMSQYIVNIGQRSWSANTVGSITCDTFMWFRIKYNRQNCCIMWLLISLEIWSWYYLFC